MVILINDVDKWWAYVDDLIRDWICLLCYVSNVIAYVNNWVILWCDVSILGGMSMYMCYAWNPWMLMFVYVDYDWCEANPQWFWPPTCLFEWVNGVHE